LSFITTFNRSLSPVNDLLVKNLFLESLYSEQSGNKILNSLNGLHVTKRDFKELSLAGLIGENIMLFVLEMYKKRDLRISESYRAVNSSLTNYCVGGVVSFSSFFLFKFNKI